MSASLIRSLAPHLSESFVVHLFGGPYVTIGNRRTEVPEGSKRLLVFVTLNGGRVERRHAAGALWPEGGDLRAAGNLRSALWRLRGAGLDLLDCDKSTLELRDGAIVDVSVVCGWASRLINGTAHTHDLLPADIFGEVLDLLPGWYDDWVIFERERIRQRLMHALESLSRRLVSAGRHADAIEAAMRALAADPLRESAVRVLLEAHQAEGNLCEARRVYRRYADAVTAELGVPPSPQLRALMGRATLSSSADG
jgi:DNA-binding SARP family transcriptional activator